MSSQDFPWYGISRDQDKPQQGDLLRNVPIVQVREILPKPGEEVTPVIKFYDMIVLSQSCDLAHNGKVKRVQLAPVETLKRFAKNDKRFNDPDNEPDLLNELRKNNIPRYYLLNYNRKRTFGKTGYLVIDFGNVHSISVRTLQALCVDQPKRVRLLSPYKEQMSQQFARFYMRVGLPEDIPIFTKKINK